eukprot:gnl/MRDRNA2_/MRDRNA2_65243_c0_seq1.p1 gnl/MRDRNA2_/MRDRNA2_65243_c0~~gnl/MRDRNA2_/MRDRNA2_65243_c0_seq1.p1  ORF type:complete len:164 (-),score=13.74 gnl/MRDRNA2_/MRDRNA2_65243_c0_seq1:327-818(-)
MAERRTWVADGNSSDSDDDGGACEARAFGRIRRFRVCGDCYCFVGPDWPASVVLAVIIFGIGGVYVAIVAPQVGLEHIYLGIASTLFSSITFLHCVLADPGIVQAVPEDNRKVHYCDICKVDIDGHDHHCPFMGKCIGSGTCWSFYTFLMVSMLSLIRKKKQN